MAYFLSFIHPGVRREREKEARRVQINYFSLKGNAATSDLPRNPHSSASIKHEYT